MTPNIKAFLEADAKWRNSTNGHSDAYVTMRDAAMNIAPDIRAMQDAFEKVCETLEIYAASDNGAYQLLKGFGGRTGDVCPRSPANKALTAAAPFRKGGE